MSVFEVGKTISESVGGAAVAGGNSGLGNRFFFTDDTCCEIGLQRGSVFNVTLKLQENTSVYLKVTMIGHRGYAPTSFGNNPFCYIVEALPQNMGDRTALNSTVTGPTTRSFEEGIEAQHLMGIQAGDLYPTVSSFQYTGYTEITLRVLNMSYLMEQSKNKTNVVDTTATDHSASKSKFYKGSDGATLTDGQAGEQGGDAIFFTAYIEGYSYNSPLIRRLGYGENEGLSVSYDRFMGGRHITAGGYTTTYIDTIDYNTIGVLGNATDFGELSALRNDTGGLSNGSRGLFGGGDIPPVTGAIEYITFVSLSDATDFGELTQNRTGIGAEISDGSRGLFHGGNTPPFVNTIDYVTIGIPDQTALDFGDSTYSRQHPSGVSNGSRGVMASGEGPPGNVDTIDYVTIGNITNAIDFGEVTQERRYPIGASDASRGTFCGGYTTTNVDTIDYINIGALGDATDFGNLSQARHGSCTSSDGCRQLVCGGYVSAAADTIDYHNIPIVGNSADFGDLTQARANPGGASGD